MQPIAASSPRRTARLAAIFYLLAFVTGIVAQFYVSGRLVAGNAEAASANILAHRDLYELGFTLYMVEMASSVVMTALFYVLLAPVSRTWSLVSAFLGLAGCAIKTCGRAFYFAPLLILGNSHGPSGFAIPQQQSLAWAFLGVNDMAAKIALGFFGCAAIVKGGLILKSTFLPRILGALGVLAGVGWTTYFVPQLGDRLFPVLMLLGFGGTVLLIFWLLVFGVDETKWREQAAVTASSS